MPVDRREKIAFVRVLAAAMWGDGRVDQKELDFLRDVFNSLLLDREDWKQIAPFLESPVHPGEFEAAIRDLTKPAGPGADPPFEKNSAGCSDPTTS